MPPKTMQMTSEKKVAKSKKSGLTRLKTGVKSAPASKAPEETKGGDSAHLHAQIAKL